MTDPDDESDESDEYGDTTISKGRNRSSDSDDE